jgi:hypothetical protein
MNDYESHPFISRTELDIIFSELFQDFNLNQYLSQWDHNISS